MDNIAHNLYNKYFFYEIKSIFTFNYLEDELNWVKKT